MTITIERTSGQITITADERGHFDARLSTGKRIEVGICSPITLAAAGIALPVQHRGKYTHVLGNICLTSPEAAALEEMAQAARAAHDLTPAGLREQRDRLVEAIGYALDDWHETHQRAVEQMSATGTTRIDADAKEPAVVEARQALAAFDAAHPEIAQLVEADRIATVERAMWQ